MTNDLSYCKILDFPPLPSELVQQALSITADPSKSYLHIPPDTETLDNNNGSGSIYNRYQVSSEIFDWVTENIPLSYRPQDFKIGIQVFRPLGDLGMYDPHTDGHRGPYVLNYLIDPGGDNVLTKWYHEEGYDLIRPKGVLLKTFKNLTEVHSECIPQGSWFCLYARVVHAVINIERPRIALSIGIDHMVAPGGNDPPTDAYQASVIPFN